MRNGRVWKMPPAKVPPLVIAPLSTGLPRPVMSPVSDRPSEKAMLTPSPRPVFRISSCHGLPCLGRFFGPGRRDVEQGEDGALDLGEPVEDDSGRGVGQVQAVEGGQDGAGGGLGG